MTILITGVAGFVGSTLARRLLDMGESVVGIDAITDYYDVSLKRRNLESLQNDRFEFLEGDINTLNLDAIQPNVEYVFHQAGQPGVRASWGADFETYTASNVNATQKLLEAFKDSKSLKRFVYASSSSVYGNAETYPTNELVRPQPRSPYGVTKLAAEHLCSLYAANFGMPTVSLRYFTVYGPKQRPDMAFTRFLTCAISGRPISLFGTGNQIRDFTYIDDVIEANIAAAQSELPPDKF